MSPLFLAIVLLSRATSFLVSITVPSIICGSFPVDALLSLHLLSRSFFLNRCFCVYFCFILSLTRSGQFFPFNPCNPY